MMEFAEARRAAIVLAALAEPTRLRIVFHLISGPHNVGQLAELIGTPMVNMSHHLGVMRQAGVLEDAKDGRKVIYRVRPEVFTPGDGNNLLGTLALGPFRLTIHAQGEALAIARPRGKSKAKQKPKPAAK
jgi:DNA-binding transcriptional ArsR family regulator